MASSFAPELDDRPRPVAVSMPRVRAQAIYEAGSQSKRTLGWHAPTASPNAGLANLTTLRDRSRAGVRNDGNAKGIIDMLVANIIGTGIQPRSQATDKVFRTAVNALWLDWTDESDADGMLDWYGQQAQAVRCWLEAGEVFARLRPRLLSDGLSVPLQVQLLEPELCPHTYNVVLPNGNRVRAGIEFDAIGRRVAYYFHPQRPGDFQDFDAGQLRRIPAEGVIHLYVPLRAGQIRGIPHLTPALIRLHEMDKYDDATLLRQQLANLFVAFLTRASGAEFDIDPVTGQAIDTSEARPTLRLEPAAFQELGTGEDVKFAQPPDPPAGYIDFIKQHLRSACAAAGAPYELVTGDMSGLNDRVMRVLLIEFRRRVQSWQHQVVAFQLCRPVWRAWMDRVFLSGALPIPATYIEDASPWAAAKWQPQSWPYINPVQDVQANREAVRAGFKSRSAVVAEQGDDSEEVDRENQSDNERADNLALTYESDGRTKMGAGGASKPDGGGEDPDREPEEPPPPPTRPMPYQSGAHA